MRRRTFITLLGGAAAAWPLAARAQQQPRAPTIGFLHSASADGSADRVRPFRQGLKEAGLIEGENVTVEYRWAAQEVERLPALANELVRHGVVAIAAMRPAATFAAKAATAAIPIVFVVPEDPVRLGLVTTLARPGGNLTGVNFFPAEVSAKRLALLRELVPQALRIAVLIDSNNPSAESTLRDLEVASRATGLQIQVFRVSTSREIDAVFAGFGRERPDAVFADASSLFVDRRVQLALQAMLHRLPSAFHVRELAEAGGLMSYGTSLRDSIRQAGAYAGRIVKGAKPADLPVVQSSKFELVINAQTARMLGLTVPPSLLALADEVIE
ncbi:MAG TPA: ABC transporter substrate-binding protein [Xanthobacteraceae bacterium]|nr:ABC transporter substrate-binding protein [Xanthobacteraceae bacterium]